MSRPAGPALELALACHRAPSLLAAAQSRPLPGNMLTLLRLAAGDQAMAAQCAQASGESETEVVQAAAFFIQQVLFAPGADSYRVLGVNAGAPDDRIKEHYRWLVRWLHPDRNTDQWYSIYADRVNVAWQALRLPDRRRSYDAALEESAVERAALQRPVRDRALHHLPVQHDAPEPSMLSPGLVEKLPVLVLGGLGSVAIALLLLMWLAADVPVSRPAALPEAAQYVAAGVSPEAVEPAAADEPAVSVEPIIAAMAASAPPPAAAPPPSLPAPTLEPEPGSLAVAPANAAPAPASERGDVALPSPVPAAAPAPAPAAATAPAAPAPAAAASTTTTTTLPIAATASAAATPSAPSSEPALQEAQAHALLRRFSQAYEAGDIRALMQLFTLDARNNRGGRDAIAYDYQSLFSATQARELRVTPSGWMAHADGGTVLGRYEAVVQTRDRASASVTRGDIRFDLRVEDGAAKISLVRHDEAR